MVSNGERVVSLGQVPTLGSLETRQWSALMPDFVQNMNTEYADKYTVSESGTIDLVNFSLLLLPYC